MNFHKRKVKRWVSTFMAFLLLLSTFLPSGLAGKAYAQIADHVVISQVFGGGGNSGAPYKNDFIELYNPNNQLIDLSGWKVQYASSTGAFSDTSNSITITKSIPGYGYYLIQGSAGTSGGAELPTPDDSGTMTMAKDNGKVRLVDKEGNVIDLVGFGSATTFEGTATKALSNTTSAQRRPASEVDPAPGKGNAWDSNDNSLDFYVGPVAASRNTASPAETPIVSNASLDPVGTKIQFLQDGNTIKVTGAPGAASAQATINIYENANKGTVLKSITATADGSFEISFSYDTALASVYVSSVEGDKDESDAVQIDKAVPSTDIAQDKLTYTVIDGAGTLVGSNGAAAANAVINVYPSASANSAEKLNTTDVTAGSSGNFSINIDNAPDTVYVTQQTSTTKGIMLGSKPVSVEKAVAEAVKPIKDIKVTDTSGALTNLNQTFTVEGVVTVDNGVLGTQKNNYYIQDETGGINIFGGIDPGQDIKRGDKLRITGKLLNYRGLTELEPTVITKISAGETLPAAKDATIQDLNTFTVAEPLEGSLVKVSGKVSAVSGTSSYNVTFVDENNKATTVRVIGATGIKPDTDLISGKSYTITGIVGQYGSTSTSNNDGYQVFPRDIQDISALLTLQHTPLKEVFKDTDVEFEATASGGQSVTVYYRAAGQTDYQALPMTAGSEDRYTAVIKADDSPTTKLEYYIEAVAGDKTATSGTKAAPHQVTVVTDKEGPRFFGETPVNEIKTESPRPEISVLMDDPSGVKESSIKVEFDGKEIDYTKATINAGQVKFTPTADLALGIHTVKVTAEDLKGNTSSYNWSFETVERFTGGNHYRGTTHNHTNLSHDAAGTPEDALKEGKKHGYDWFAFSDHSHDLDPGLLGQDTVVRDGMQERTGGADWQLTKDLADQYTKNGDYVVFPAFEMTSTTWGHSNIFGSKNFIDRNINGKTYQDLNKYYAWVLTYDDIVGQFNHPDMSKNSFNNFQPYNRDVDKLFTMFEVGNGSGHYGYANAEKKFFTVLDLGWHVAPTYGEDNHEGTWGQTNARTVIVANDLSQESLLHSMRNMRVYMVEDPNFTMDVSANGYYMGSTVDSKALNFKIKASDSVTESSSMSEYSYLPADYKSDDRIEKVEILTNGGKVVKTFTPNTKSFEDEFSYTVKGGQQWFVVKITQADGERMYSAPIWSKEEPVDVKVNGIDVVGDVVVAGNPATLKANVSNNGTQEMKNLQVDIYMDEVKDANRIGTGEISSIPTKGVGSVSIVWNNPAIGDHQIIAVVTSKDGLDLGDTAFTLPVKVKEPLGINVLIDGKHGNENTSGDSGSYKDNLKSFIVLLQKEGYTVKENTSAITDDVLKNINVLVITHPKYAFTDAEKEAIAKFVENGGSLLMAGKGNNSTTPANNNAILEQIGSGIRINNDGVFDDSKTGNFWSNPATAPWAVRVFPGLVSNLITDRVSFIDYFSGASLSGPNNQPLAASNKVVILGQGNETTYQGKINGYTYDAVSDETGGSTIPLIASEELGDKGRVIVSGMNIFNDKQMDESYEPKGNDEFSLNAVNWLAHRETKITKIGDARKLAEETPVVVEGTVTTGAGVFFDAFYLQDDTGGIMAFQEVPAGALKAGDKVRVYGHIKIFERNIELEFSKFDQDVIKIGTGEPVQPKLVPTGEATSEANKGLLVKVKGKVTSQFDANSYFINDGSGDVLVFTDGYIVNQSGSVPAIKVGDTLEAVGLSGSFSQGERIRVRDTKELVVTPNNDAGNNQDGNTGGDQDGNAGNNQDGNIGGTEKPSTPVVTVTPVIDKGKAVVSMKDFEAAVKKAVETKGVMSIDLGDKDSVRLELSKEQVAQLKESGIPLAVFTKGVKVLVPNGIIAEGKDFNISVKELADIKNAKSNVFDFTIIVNGQVIHQFAEPITLTFDVDLSKVKNTNNLKVFYFNEKTKAWELVPGAVFKNGKVEVKTNHFSTYAVFETEGSKVNASAPTLKNGEKLPNTATNSYNLLFAGLLLLLIGFALVIAKRRKQA